MTLYERYGDMLRLFFFVSFYNGVRGNHIRPLEGILSIYKTPDWLHVLEIVPRAQINKPMSHIWLNYPLKLLLSTAEHLLIL